MGLSWQQGALSPGAIGQFVLLKPLSKRFMSAEPLRRRMRARCGGAWIADSKKFLLLFEHGLYPVVYFPETDVSPDTLQRINRTTRHRDLELTTWCNVRTAASHYHASPGRRPGASICCEPQRLGRCASDCALWHAHANQKNQDGRASGHHENGVTWLDYYQ